MPYNKIEPTVLYEYNFTIGHSDMDYKTEIINWLTDNLTGLVNIITCESRVRKFDSTKDDLQPCLIEQFCPPKFQTEDMTFPLAKNSIYSTVIISFEKEEDAAAFKLRFS